MRRRARWAWLLATAAGVYVSGCTRSSTRKNVPPDPLLISKTPAQSKFVDIGDVASRAEPVPPAIPAGAWADGPAQPTSPVRLGPPDFGPPRDAALVHSTDRPYLTDLSAQDPLASPYARASDYRWVQGVLEGSADSGWVVRYEAVSRDARGGKLALEGHPRLDLLQAGDVIRVEGSLIEERPGTSVRRTHPRYRVQGVQLIRRKNP